MVSLTRTNLVLKSSQEGTGGAALQYRVKVSQAPRHHWVVPVRSSRPLIPDVPFGTSSENYPSLKLPLDHGSQRPRTRISSLHTASWLVVTTWLLMLRLFVHAQAPCQQCRQLAAFPNSWMHCKPRHPGVHNHLLAWLINHRHAAFFPGTRRGL